MIMGNNALSFENFTAQLGDSEAVLGKLLYLTIGNCLVQRNVMAEIVNKAGLSDLKLRQRSTAVDAFKSATGDIQKRYTTIVDGRPKIINVLVRDNDKSESKKEGKISRELIKEIVGRNNSYINAGNFILDKETEQMEIQLVSKRDEDGIDYGELSDEAMRLFELYKTCHNRTSVVNILENIIYGMDAVDVSIHGKLYFIPRYRMDDIVKLENVLDMIQQNNFVRDSYVGCNHIYVTNDEKQKQIFEREYYATVKKDLEAYQNQLQHFIETGRTSEKIINKWVEKIDKLMQKKKSYEELFSKALDDLNDDMQVINMQIQELLIRLDKHI